MSSIRARNQAERILSLRSTIIGLMTFALGHRGH